MALVRAVSGLQTVAFPVFSHSPSLGVFSTEVDGGFFCVSFLRTPVLSVQGRPTYDVV